MPDSLDQFKNVMSRVKDLTATAMILQWDQETMMPPGGAQARARQLGSVYGVIHQMITDEQAGALLESVEPRLADLPFESDDAALIRLARREFDKRTKIPLDLVVEIAQTAGLAKEAWKEARARNDFSIFEPLLEKTVALQIRKAQCFGSFENPYDALLDDFEPGLSYEYIDGVFSDLKPKLIALVKDIAAHQDTVNSSVMRREVPAEKQIALGKQIVEQVGYDFQRGRLDLSAHPFTSGTGSGDARITTRVLPGNLASCLMAVIHEAGHGMHLQNISPALATQPTGMFSTLAIAEFAVALL